MSHNDLEVRTNDICAQLTRYSDCVACTELADVLDEIVDLNDDIHNGRHISCMEQSVAEAKRKLDVLLQSLKDSGLY